MRFLLPSLLALGLAACATGPDISDELLDDYQSRVETMHDQVAAWHDEVATAQAMQSIDDSLATYEQEMGHSLDDLLHTLEEMEGCEMGEMGMGHMSEAHHDLDAMDDEMVALHDDHDEHGDASECDLAAEHHAEWMHDTLDEMEQHHDGMHEGSMQCMGHQDDHDDDGHHGGGHDDGGHMH